MSGRSGLKVFMSVDMEGISGIVHGSQTSRDQHDYEKGRALMVGDVNAAIEGVLAFGDAEIVVADGHGGMMNMQPEDLHEAAVLVRGRPKPLSQVAGMDETYDAALFVGYHSKKGTKHGVMSHTYSGASVERLTVNGIELGETAMNAAIAGHYGVPLVFVAGDVATTLEAKELSEDIEVAAVKEAIGRTAAKCLHPDVAHELITEGVARALKKKVEPFTFEPPITVQIRFTGAKRADAAAFIPTAERLDGKTIRFKTDDYITAFHAFIASVLCAQAVSR